MDSRIKIHIIDARIFLRQKVKTLIDSHQSAGKHSAIWDATDDSNNPVSSGIYFYKLEAGDQVLQKKMIFLK